MEELASLWNYDYQQNYDDLKLKFQFTAIELESVRMEANDQIRKYKEELKLMLNLLNLAYQERDEARDQLHKLLLNNKIIPSSYPQPETPILVAARTNSSITESNSLSDHTYNNHHHSHGSSPVDSLFDAVTSPDFPAVSSGIGLMNQPLVQDFNTTGSMAVPVTTTTTTSKVDGETALIDNLAKGKALPEKGKLLQTVMEAGPLLSTLLLAGPLPQWRNPPPPDTFKIPPVSINGADSKPAANPNKTVRKRVSSSSQQQQHQMSRGSHQMCSSAMLSFASSGSGLSRSQVLSSSKRQRFE